MLFNIDNAGQALSNCSGTTIRILGTHMSLSLPSVVVCSTATCICLRRQLAASITFSALTSAHVTRGGCISLYYNSSHPWYPLPSVNELIARAPAQTKPVWKRLDVQAYRRALLEEGVYDHPIQSYYADAANPRFFSFVVVGASSSLPPLRYTHIRTTLSARTQKRQILYRHR
jgi:hypothetical protein